MEIYCYGWDWLGFPDSSVGKESTYNAGDPSLISGSGRSAGEGIGYPLQDAWASLVAQLVKNLLQCRRPEFNPWVGKIPWRRERLPTPVFWPGEFHGLYSTWGPKELDTTEWLSLSFWGWLYVWICIKYITNGNLMYSPGDSTWSSVETQMGRKSQKRGDVYGWLTLLQKLTQQCKEAMCMCAQLCLTLCNSIDCSLPGSTVHAIFQARIREWVDTSFYRGSSQTKDPPHISCIGRWVLYRCTTWEAKKATLCVFSH